MKVNLKEGENHLVSVVGMITGKCSALTNKQEGEGSVTELSAYNKTSIQSN